jgi:phosphoribosylformylglycinamidine synthase subunit PurSL
MRTRLAVTDRNEGASALRRALAARHLLGESAEGIELIEATTLYLLDRQLTEEERSVIEVALVDPATHIAQWSDVVPGKRLDRSTVEVALRPGVTDPVGAAFQQAVSLLDQSPVQARSGTRYHFVGQRIDADCVLAITDALLHNDIVDEVAYEYELAPGFLTAHTNAHVEIVALRQSDERTLGDLSLSRGLALDPAELLAVRDHFVSLERDPTDAELETIAQTWSEHCSHKTFRAHITWDDGTVVEPLLKQLRRSTEEIGAPFVKSAFVDNAGIIAFDDRYDVAIKVETHNHPSAIEPFGGSNTGVGGVIRDVLGVAADPIATTDILCFGPLDLPASQLPAGVLHPQRIRSGVIAGIADYGNKLGVPTIAGAIVHHSGFTANPLVFCGCIGLRPAGLQLTGQKPGDRIIVIGGATGRDGIRGATFSSATMDATTGDVAGASVQIGDPIIEKLVADVLRVARDQQLFTAITDCGAGGFSSAVGELAAELGATVNLDTAPRKYPGLAPWEMWLSEAQERMVLAVRQSNVEALQKICDAHNVLMADLGEFRNDGQLVVMCDGSTIVDLHGSFLHEGRPTRTLTASRTAPVVPADERNVNWSLAHLGEVLLSVLRHSDVRSNEDVVRGYDHEILGATIGRPYLGANDDGPADAAVLAPSNSRRALAGHAQIVGATFEQGQPERGLAIGIGLNCRSGHLDARRMARAAVDEAVRNVVCVGADPDQLVLLDNFSWGDPRRPQTLGQLVDAVAGCVDGANHFRAPFVSGKDSLNNEYLTADGTTTSIPPTLVITALGILPDAQRLVTSDAKRAGNHLVLVGGFPTELRSGVLDAVMGIDGPGDIPGGLIGNPDTYRALHRLMTEGRIAAAHDVSDGGLLGSVAEMSIGGRLGIDLDLHGLSGEMLLAGLFGESCGRIVLEVHPDDLEIVCAHTGAMAIGHVTSNPVLNVWCDGINLVDLSIEQLLSAWQGHFGSA